MYFLLKKCLVIRVFTLTALLLTGFAVLQAQPNYESKTEVNGRQIFRDGKIKNKYYYGPGKLSLSTDSDGKPVFQLVTIRYTGTQITNDRNEKRFTNILNFGVTMEPMTAAAKAGIKKSMNLPAAAELTPLPIRHLAATIVSGLGKGSDQDVIRKQAGSDQPSDTGPGIFWTERTFTVSLDNHEAQILHEQYKNGAIAVSLNYTFYANVLKIEEEIVQISGDSVMVESLNNEIGEMQRDTQLVSYPVLGDALSISIDVTKFPDAIRKIDVNEQSIPPAYAALEVKCFDFAVDSRPDLSMKTVEIEAQSVTNVPVVIKTKFFKKQPDITGKFVSFPYAVFLDKPIRYRVNESDLDGESTYSPWTVLEQNANLIDITTPQKKNPVKKRSVDVEVLPEVFSDKNIKEFRVHFTYIYGGKPEVKSLIFNKEDTEYFKNITVVFESDYPMRYLVSRVYENGKKTRGIPRAVGTDDYILIKN